MKLYVSETAECRLTDLEWAFALRLAQQYEWQPDGTESPRHAGGAQSTPPEQFNGSYVDPQSQRIHADDCDRLADALEKGLLESLFQQEAYLAPEARDRWSALIAFLRTAASRKGLFLIADGGMPSDDEL